MEYCMQVTYIIVVTTTNKKITTACLKNSMESSKNLSVVFKIGYLEKTNRIFRASTYIHTFIQTSKATIG